MVLTVEPGLYIPAAGDDVPAPFRGIGIRIEDDVLVTADGHECSPPRPEAGRGGGSAPGGCGLMPGPMEGIRVVELGFWVAGPSAGAVLADWGAEVVKIEPPDGDPSGTLPLCGGSRDPREPALRARQPRQRSIALNLRTAEGRRVADQLIDRADVFVTNVRPEILDGFGLEDTRLRARIRGSSTGASPGTARAARSDRPAYDVGAFWSRAGIAAALTPPGADPPCQRGAMGITSPA